MDLALEYIGRVLVGPGSTKGAGHEVEQQSREKLYSILRYAESSRGFTEIKQVSIQGINARNTFVLRVEHHYIVRKSRKYLPCQENCMLPIAAAHQKYLASAQQISHENCKKHSIRAVAPGIRRFHGAVHHQIAECT